MKRIVVLAVLFCLALPIVASMADDTIQSAVQLMHQKEFHFRVIADAGRATINVAKYGRPDELTFATTGMCSVLVYRVPPFGTNVQAGRWDRFGCGGTAGTSSVADAFTYGMIGIDSIRVHNYSGANIVVRTWSWRR
jgi:hypothetical protein